MTFNQFSSRQDILLKLLASLGILTTKRIVIRIDNNPNYDISKYQVGDDADYFFKNFWDFSNEFNLVVDIEFIDTKLFHFDDLERSSAEYNLPFNREDHLKFINKVNSLHKSWFSKNGMQMDIDQFKLHHLRKISIDNIKKKLYYEGSFFGNHETFDPLDWGIYSLVELNELTQDSSKFYKNLIGESYLLQIESKYKLAYFLAYSAFESFVNKELNIKNDEKRLKEKITELFRTKFPQLERHQIYSSVINFYDGFTENRNNIAHGLNEISISKETFQSALLSILTLIYCYEFDIKTFEDLIKTMTQQQLNGLDE